MMQRCATQFYAMVPWGPPVNLHSIMGGAVLLDYSGLGITDVQRLTERAVLQHGHTDVGFQQSGRQITLNFGIAGEGQRPLMAKEELRNLLLATFRPRLNDPVPLRIITPTGYVRQTDVNLIGTFSHKKSDEIGYAAETLVLALESGDPYLYDPRQREITFSIVVSEGSAAGWEIPWDIPWSIGSSGLFSTQAIEYGGNTANTAAPEYPIIRVTGPIDEPIISNLTTDEHLKFTAEGGLSVPSGGYVEIDLRFGYKTVRDQNGTSVDQYLSDDSDLASWHLAYRTELLSSGDRCDGTNQISVSGSGATLNSSVSLFFYDRFIGI